MDNISKFLERFKNFIPQEILLKRALVEIILEVTGRKLKTTDIKIFKNKAFINCSPNLKNLIFIKKNKILEKFNSKNFSLKDFDIK